MCMEANPDPSPSESEQTIGEWTKYGSGIVVRSRQGINTAIYSQDAKPKPINRWRVLKKKFKHMNGDHGALRTHMKRQLSLK